MSCFFSLTDLTVPQEVNLSSNMQLQQISISWFGGQATTFDLIILRTEFNETVFYVRSFFFLLENLYSSFSYGKMSCLHSRACGRMFHCSFKQPD